MNDIKIFVSCHKPCRVHSSKFLYPLQVGAALSDKKIDGFYYDDDGENISHKNRYYCELTGQYWAWKNADADYYGFMHYRRYFSFAGKKLKQNGIGDVVAEDLSNESMARIGFTDDNIESVVAAHDLIIPKKTFIFSKVRNEYKASVFQFDKDFKFCIDIIENEFPHMKSALHSYLNARSAYLRNMFIMKKELFLPYAEWLFYILGKHEAALDFDRYDVQSYRVSGYLAERLCGIYLTWLQEDKNLKVKELQNVFIKASEKKEELQPRFNDVAAIAFPAAASGFYNSAVLLQSLLDNAVDGRNYDFLAIEPCRKKERLSARQKAIMTNMTKGRGNISFRFAANGAAGDYISALPNICKNYDKVLHLSERTLICGDISDVLDTDISAHSAACVEDVHFAIAAGGHKIKRAKKTNARLGAAYYYETKEVQLRSDAKKDVYVSGDVALLNIKKLAGKRPLERAVCPHDSINYLVKGDVLLLGLEHNCPFDDCGLLLPMVFSYAPHYMNDEYLAARKAPVIVNFSGHQNPLRFPACDMAEKFWGVARRTPVYEEMLTICAKKPRTPAPIIKNKIKNFFLPPGSPLWQGYTRFIKKH